MSKKRFSADDTDTGLYDSYRTPLPGYPGTPGFSTGGKTKGYGSCYESHPELDLGGGKFIGGSCISPVTSKADIYIGFDRGMHVTQAYPWDNMPVQVLYPITDMSKPSDSKSFIKLIDWSIERLAEGKTVHAGCIGGHGRTGTYLAALVAALGVEKKEAIQWARKNYCKKAVESSIQVDFLTKHFGVGPATGAKEFLTVSGTGWGKSGGGSGKTSVVTPPRTGGKELHWGKPKSTTQFADAKRVFNPVKSVTCIFGSLF